MKTALERCAALAVTTRRAELPAEVMHAATRTVVDWMAATITGAAMRPASVMSATLLDGHTSGTARLVVDGRQTDPRTAALINGTASHTAEVDDIYREGIYHPGSPTIAAALAAAQHANTDGAQFLRAVTIGYEIGDRLAEAVQPAHYRYWHTTGTIGTVGAAAAVAEILRLDSERFTHAIALATTMASGLQQAFRSDTMSKPLHAGHAADAGLLAGMLAAAGFTGAADVFEGAAGFVPAMVGSTAESMISGIGEEDDAFDGSALTRRARIVRTTVKPYACCGHAFAAVDAALALRVAGLDPGDIDRIEISTYRAAVEVAGNTEPVSEFDAKFSLGYCVAAAFVLGGVQLGAFDDRARSNDTIRKLLGHTSLRVAPDLDALFPNRRAAELRVWCRDGTEVVQRRETRKGDPDDPLSDEDLRAKFTDLATPVLGVSVTQDLSDRLWALPSTTDLRALPLAVPSTQ